MNKRTCYSLILLAVTVLFGFATNQSYGFSFTSEESFSVTTINPGKNDIVDQNGPGYAIIQQALAALLPAQVDIDALDFIDSSNVVFSLKEDANIPGPGQVADEDLLLYNGSSISLLFDGSANGIPPVCDIDAVDVLSLSPLTCSSSLREGANIPGVGQVSRNDAIRFQGSAFTGIDFKGVTAGIPLITNLDGFSRPDGSNYTLSLETRTKISGTDYGKSDLINYNIGGGTFSLFFNASTNSIPGLVNIQDIETKPGVLPVDLWEYYGAK